jgi:hypothetical protein
MVDGGSRSLRFVRVNFGLKTVIGCYFRRISLMRYRADWWLCCSLRGITRGRTDNNMRPRRSLQLIKHFMRCVSPCHFDRSRYLVPLLNVFAQLGLASMCYVHNTLTAPRIVYLPEQLHTVCRSAGLTVTCAINFPENVFTSRTCTNREKLGLPSRAK